MRHLMLAVCVVPSGCAPEPVLIDDMPLRPGRHDESDDIESRQREQSTPDAIELYYASFPSAGLRQLQTEPIGSLLVTAGANDQNLTAQIRL